MRIIRIKWREPVVLLIVVALTFVSGIGNFTYYNNLVIDKICEVSDTTVLEVKTVNLNDHYFEIIAQKSDSHIILIDSSFRQKNFLENNSLPRIYKSQVYLTSNPELMRWVLVNLFFCAFSWASLWPNLLVLFDLCKALTRRVVIITIAIAASIILIVNNIAHEDDRFLNIVQILKQFKVFIASEANSEFIINLFVGTIMGASLLGFMGILFLNLRIARYSNLLKQGEKALVSEYEYLSGRLNYLSLFLAIMTSSSILASGSFRLAVIKEIPGFDYFYPQEIVYGYGAIFSFFLLIIYAPTWWFLNYNAQKYLVESKPEFKEMLQFNLMEKIQTAFSIMLPILSSFVQ